MVSITKENYENFSENKVSILYVSASWCNPCKMFSPIMQQISTEIDDITIGKMDADEMQEEVQNLKVRNLPTVIYRVDGIEVDRKSGVQPKQQILDFIDVIK